MATRQTTASLDHDRIYSACSPFCSKAGRRPQLSGSVLYGLVRRVLLDSEVIGSQASVVDVQDQPGIVDGGVENLERIEGKRF